MGVYLIHALDALELGVDWDNKEAPNGSHLVKIGHTRTGDSDSRIAGMQTGCPFKLTLIAEWLNDNCDLERNFCRILRNDDRQTAIRGEWFWLNEDEIGCLYSACDIPNCVDFVKLLDKTSWDWGLEILEGLGSDIRWEVKHGDKKHLYVPWNKSGFQVSHRNKQIKWFKSELRKYLKLNDHPIPRNLW